VAAPSDETGAKRGRLRRGRGRRTLPVSGAQPEQQDDLPPPPNELPSLQPIGRAPTRLTGPAPFRAVDSPPARPADPAPRPVAPPPAKPKLNTEKW
jgi:hypothetical protein